MKAALYIRVSTTHQIDKDSLPFQRSELENYSKYVLGIDDFVVFTDAGYSGKNTDRPEYQEMISRIHAGEFTHLLVWKIDRISRNLRDFTEMYDDLKNHNVTFISKNEQFDTSSAMGEAMLKIILVFAELERKLTGERVYSIMLSRAEKGLWNGATVPLGYVWSDEKKFPVIDEAEAQTVHYIYKLYLKIKSTVKVAYQLNDEKVTSKRNGRWTAKTVNDILRNPFYIGTYRYNVRAKDGSGQKDESEWIVIEDNHPGIINKETFEKANEFLSKNRRNYGHKNNRNIHHHAFRNLIICDRCGHSFISGLDRPRQDGFRPSRYFCGSSRFVDTITGCSNFISDLTLVPFVINYIANFINLQSTITINSSLSDIEKQLLRGKAFIDVTAIDKAGLESTREVLIKEYNSKFHNTEQGEIDENSELISLNKSKKKYEKALERLDNLFLYDEAGISTKDYIFKKKEITQNIEQLEIKLKQYHEENSKVSIASALEFLNTVSYYILNKEISKKRYIDHREILEKVDNETLHEFFKAAIKSIKVRDKKVMEINFNNGVTHRFDYKSEEKQQYKPITRLRYLNYDDEIIEYLKEHKYITRPIVEKLTGLRSHSALTLLHSFEQRGIVERKGESISTRYQYIENETAN